MREDWIETPLGEVAEIRLGKMLSRPSREHPERSPYVRNANVQWDELRLDDLKEMHFSEKERAEFALRAGDVLVCEGGEVGRCVMLESDLPGIYFQKALHRVRCGPQLEPRFLTHALRYAATRDGLVDLATQNTIQHLTKEKLEQLLIALPPRDEQRRIVNVIASVDALRIRLDGMQRMSEVALQAIREQTAAGAQLVPLGELAEHDGVQIGPFGSQLHAHEYQREGIPVVMPQDLVDRKIDEMRIARISPEKAETLLRHRMRIGDIVLPRRGDLTKRALVGPRHDGWLCGTGSVRVRLRGDVDSRVVFELLSTRATDDWLITNAVGTTMPNLNTDIVRNIPVPLVHGQEADAFLTVATGLTRQLDRIREVRACGSVLRGALLNDLLSGTQEITESYDALLAGAASA